MNFYAWEHFMLVIFRGMVCLITCTILEISSGYSQTNKIDEQNFQMTGQ